MGCRGAAHAIHGFVDQHVKDRVVCSRDAPPEACLQGPAWLFGGKMAGLAQEIVVKAHSGSLGLR